MSLVRATVDWDKASPPSAEIVGGRWDGHSVLYTGPLVEYKGRRYVSLRSEDGRWFYLQESMLQEWFRVR